jgi:bifunctional non-homologous end joining protein LigD
MLAIADTTAPTGEQWVYEPKWDGIRAVTSVRDGRLRVRTRRGRDVTEQFPELNGLVEAVERDEPVILDGELVVLVDGHPDFGSVISRMQTPSSTAARAARQQPATLMVFDVMEHRGADLRLRPWTARREILESLELSGPAWDVNVVGDDPDEMIAVSDQYGLEGILAKRRDSTYHHRRTRDWVKVKHRHLVDLYVGGWRDTADGLTLLLGEQTEDGLEYRGGVSRDVERVPDLKVALKSLSRKDSPFSERISGEAGKANWVDPLLPVEVEYGSTSADRRLRQPRLVRVRIDML